MIFDEYAKGWDTDRRIERAKIIAYEIANALEIGNEYTAMEFGCGTGLISFNLRDSFKEITLIDSSKSMIDILNSKIDKYKADNMHARLLDNADLYLLDERYDVIYSSMVMHHINDIGAAIKSFYKMLKNNGYLCIVDLDEEDGSFHKGEPGFAGHNGFNQAALKAVFCKAGFTDVEANTFYHDKKVVEGAEVNYSLFLIKGRK